MQIKCQAFAWPTEKTDWVDSALSIVTRIKSKYKYNG